MSEYYRGHTTVCSYIRKRNKNCSFSEFIDLYKEIIIEAPPYADDWYDLEEAWTTRFLRDVKDIIPDKYDDIHEKVKLETSKKSLMIYWQEIIIAKQQVSVKNNYSSNSLDILNVAAKHSADILIQEFRKKPIPENVDDDVNHHGKHPMTDVDSVASKKIKTTNIDEENAL